jgi:hypothetical protein
LRNYWREYQNFSKESLGYYELKQLFDEGCPKLLDQRKQVKLRLLQDPSEIIGDGLNSVSREASRYFRNKRREYVEDKINELATHSKKENFRDLYIGINEFQKGYQHRANLVKDQIGNFFLTYSHNILNT